MMTFVPLTAGAEKMAATDPHGWTLTIVCVLVVFGCLLLLYGVYSLLGTIMGRKAAGSLPSTGASAKQDDSCGVHDNEPGIITIRTKGWNGNTSGNVLETSEAAGTRSDGARKESVRKDGKGWTVTAPLPGMIVEIAIREGEHVKRGQKIAVLEAMKMENEILSETEGIVKAIYVTNGDSLQEGDKVARIE